MIDRGDANFETGDQYALRALNLEELAKTVNEVFNLADIRLTEASSETARMAGRGFDAFYVRNDISKIGGVPCNRLRFTPPFKGTNENRAGFHPLYQDVKQLIVETPNEANCDTSQPQLMFFALSAYDGAKAHFILSKNCLIEIDPRDNNIEIIISGSRSYILFKGHAEDETHKLLDLDEHMELSEEELVRRVGILRLFKDIIQTYKIGNQSRNDGTAI